VKVGRSGDRAAPSPRARPARPRGPRLLRLRGISGAHVTNTELFFDLVYVFAITQITHLLLGRLSWLGAGQALMLLLAVWWAWMYTAWVTNWFHPDAGPVRAMLLAVMLVSLIMSAALPGAFGGRGLLFACAYVVMQVGRTVFVVAAAREQQALRRNFQRILAWSAVAGAGWLAGGFAHGAARYALWLAALAVDYASPAAGFYTPGLGRSQTTDWTIAGSHLAERCQLFLIIVLGESILDSGAAFGGRRITVASTAAVVFAFLASVALWWIYFNRAADDSAAAIGAADDPGRLGRSAYVYFHLPMVAGVIVLAVADDLVIAHPGGHPAGALTAAVIGGPALFLAGHALFKRAIFGVVSVPRLAALAALAALIPAGLVAPPLVLLAAVTAVLAGVAVWDGVTPHPAPVRPAAEIGAGG
jgi:low temperature requirement protein LtrA